MVRTCTQCHVRQEDEEFLYENSEGYTRTCTRCRERSRRCANNKKQERTIMTEEWKKANTDYIRLYNEFYRQYSHMQLKERQLIWEEIKKMNGISDRVKGVASKHRKLHTEMDGVKGKQCSVPGCGWKPLTEFNYSSQKWDQLRTTCKACLAKKRKTSKSSFSDPTTDATVSEENISFRLHQNIRGRILMSINENNKRLIKHQKMIHYLGCSMDDFTKHIESLFTDGMSWDKYGFYIDSNGIKQIGFHIDHIIPCNAFDLNDPYQLLLCFHWKNCQPLWGRDNIRKGCKYRMADKIKYIESQRDIINHEKADQLVQTILEQIKTEEAITKEIIDASRRRLERQQELYQEYLHEQCLEGVQVLFFMNESPATDKDYKATAIARMKNKASRKSGSENPRSKEVCQLSMDGDLLCTYESMNQAAHENKTFHASISKCCSNPDQLYSCGGFRWCFEEHLVSVQQRCRLVRVLTQLIENTRRYEETLPVQRTGPAQSEASKKKIAETVKQYYQTDAGKESKKKAHEKRSETMNAKREQLRNTMTEKLCRVCQKLLPVCSFSKKSAASDGLQPYCKPCSFEKKKSYSIAKC